MLGDFHPLTPYSLKKSDWIAWQYNRPDKGEGGVQAFGRDDCSASEIRLKLRGLDARSTYTVEDLRIGGFKHGILLLGPGSEGNTIARCFLGVGPDGRTPMPNNAGVVFVEGPRGNVSNSGCHLLLEV